MARAQRDETADLVLECAIARECNPAELNRILLLRLIVSEVEVVNIAEFLAGQEHRDADGGQHQREHPEYSIQSEVDGSVALVALLRRMQLGRLEGGTNVCHVPRPERLGAQNRAEQMVHHPFSNGDIVRGGVVDGICEVRVAAVEVTVAEVVVPDAVLRDHVAHAFTPGCLTELRGDVISGKPTNLVAVAEVPDGIDNGTAVIRARIGARKIAAAVLGEDNEWLSWSDGFRRRESAHPKLLHEVPIADIREVIDAEPVDVELAGPELDHVQEEVARGDGTVVRECVEAKQ